jgi:hypothetical protein
MKRSIFGVLMTLIVAFTVAVPVVHAQTIMHANVPFAFSVGQTQLPAGAYSVREIGDRATLIQSQDGRDHVLGVYANAGPSKANETKLVFDKVGDRYFLTQIWTSARDNGMEIPESDLEKELRASNSGTGGGEAQTVIVALR